MTDFTPFPKVPRLSRDMIITEKLDGTNASVWVLTWPELDELREKDDRFRVPLMSVNGGRTPARMAGIYYVVAGSRKRFITPDDDNFGFASWVYDNADELVKLGPGTHFGEWWGKGIQRGYGLDERRFSLFNAKRWSPNYGEFAPGAKLADGTIVAPSCCHVVPVLHRGPFDEVCYLNADTDSFITFTMQELQDNGSAAAPGYMNPEGIMIYHTAANHLFKKTFEGDERGKEAA